MGCCSSYTPIISPFKTTIFTEVTNGQNWRVFASASTNFRDFSSLFNAVGFPVQSQPEALYSMSNALSSKTTAVAVMMDATRQDQSTAGAISCATGKKGEKRRKKEVLHCGYVGCFLSNPSAGSICIEIYIYI